MVKLGYSCIQDFGGNFIISDMKMYLGLTLNPGHVLVVQIVVL